MPQLLVSVQTAKQSYDAWCEDGHALVVGRAEEFPPARVAPLFIGEPHIPHVLAAFQMLDVACQFTNGPSVDATIEAGPDLEDPVRLPPGGRFFLGDGRWFIVWTQLDDQCRADVLVRPNDYALERLVSLRSYWDRPLVRGRKIGWGLITKLPPEDRRILAETFRYLLEYDDKPSDIHAAAAERLGLERDTVRRKVQRMREKVNSARPERARFGTAEEFGRYAVTVEAITRRDLQPPGT